MRQLFKSLCFLTCCLFLLAAAVPAFVSANDKKNPPTVSAPAVVNPFQTAPAAACQSGACQQTTFGYYQYQAVPQVMYASPVYAAGCSGFSYSSGGCSGFSYAAGCSGSGYQQSYSRGVFRGRFRGRLRGGCGG